MCTDGPFLAENGIVIDGDVESRPASWSAAMESVAPNGEKPPAFVTAEDAQILRAAMEDAGLSPPVR